MKKLTTIVAVLIFICGIMSACNIKKYNLTVDDPEGYIIEKLNERYNAGDKVTVKTAIILDASVTVYLDGVAVDDVGLIEKDGHYSHYEHYFIMPDHDAVLTFKVSGELTVEPTIDEEIKSAYIKQHPDLNLTEADIDLYHYGDFNGTYVFIMNVSAFDVAQVHTYETVDDITFCFSQDISFDVYRAGKFYSLREAFDSGLLSHDDLLNVWLNHRQDNYYLYNSGPVTLSAAEVKEITAAYIENYIDKRNLLEEKISLRCLGAFDDVYAFFLDVEGSYKYNVEIRETIADVVFVYTERIYVYSDGKFCFLNEAYENDILSKDDVMVIHKNYTDDTMIALNEPIKKEIKSAYASTYWCSDLTENDIGLRCFGSFDGVYVLFVDTAGDYNDVICRETVSGVEFIYSDSHSLTVYSQGKFCTIAQAFEKGLLTHEELLTAQKNYRAEHEYLYIDQKATTES